MKAKAVVLLLGFLAFGIVTEARAAQRPRNGPWNNDLMIAEGSDPGVFGAAQTFVPRAGVPSVIHMGEGSLVAAFQWFPENDEEHFDKVAVCFSEDYGKTWSEPISIDIAGFPPEMMRPFDPTLALLDDGKIRLYFTSGIRGPKMVPAIYSAVSAGGMHYTFETGQRLGVAGKRVIDSAVARFKGQWHMTAPIGSPEQGAYHAVSEDGLNFTRLPNIPSSGGANWTGNLLVVDDAMRFYGGSPRELFWSETRDGHVWSKPGTISLTGGDPAAVAAGNEKYLLIFTGVPRRKN